MLHDLIKNSYLQQDRQWHSPVPARQRVWQLASIIHENSPWTPCACCPFIKYSYTSRMQTRHLYTIIKCPVSKCAIGSALYAVHSAHTPHVHCMHDSTTLTLIDQPKFEDLLYIIYSYICFLHCPYIFTKSIPTLCVTKCQLVIGLVLHGRRFCPSQRHVFHHFDTLLPTLNLNCV
jgi:hypothetical protein